MTTWAALLRAVNVGGRKVPMTDLRALAADLGLRDPRTYIASGNLVFASTHRSAAAVRAVLEPALHERYGFAVDVAVRSAQQLRAVVDDQPFGTQEQVHVTYLLAPLTATQRDDLQGALRLDAEAVVAGSHVYLHTPSGFGQPWLAPAYQRRYAALGTTRNLRTATVLADMAEA